MPLPLVCCCFSSLQTEYLHSYVLTSPKLFRLDFNEYAVLLTVGGAALWETGWCAVCRWTTARTPRNVYFFFPFCFVSLTEESRQTDAAVPSDNISINPRRKYTKIIKSFERNFYINSVSVQNHCPIHSSKQSVSLTEQQYVKINKQTHTRRWFNKTQHKSDAVKREHLIHPVCG